MDILINAHIQGSYTFVDQAAGLIIFVHGLTSSKEESVIMEGEQYFSLHGYATCRFNLYGDGVSERKLITNSLAQNKDDINAVIDYFRQQGEKNIILIGHSFGGLALLYANLAAVSKIVLRDASIGGEELLSDVYEDSAGYYINRGDGYRHSISNSLYHDFCIDPETHIAQLQSLTVPVIIIYAEYGLSGPAHLYAEAIQQTPLLVSGADHTFSKDKHKQELFTTTISHL